MSRNGLPPRFRRHSKSRKNHSPRICSAGSACGRSTQELPYTSRITLLSRGETAFFGPLQSAVGGDFLIMSKVRLADMVTCSQRDWRSGFGGAISQKHLDFVLCDPKTTRFVLAVELDDRTHEAEHRKRRDRFLDQVLAIVGIRLLRIRARSSYSVPVLRKILHSALKRPLSAPSSPASFQR